MLFRSDYCGHPYYFECRWDEGSADYAGTFSLSPVDDETLRLALEQWAVWRTWELAFHSGKALEESHPGLGAIDTRYQRLELLIDERLAHSKPIRTIVSATFQSDERPSDLAPGVTGPLKVEWRVIR